MAALEEQARFLVAKYGTAAGPHGLPPTTVSSGPDIATLMIILGLLVFAVIIFVFLRDFTRLQEARRVRRESFE